MSQNGQFTLLMDQIAINFPLVMSLFLSKVAQWNQAPTKDLISPSVSAFTSDTILHAWYSTEPISSPLTIQSHHEE